MRQNDELQLHSSLETPISSVVMSEKEDRHKSFHNVTLICPSLTAVGLCLVTLIVP